ncbi:MAG TPA: hypothetical protein DCR55_14030 [Lentisphaeria bacterium]|nr:hypothetical protein [Lentisphaeria bacterium]
MRVTHSEVLIIGAGIAGLAAARRVHEADLTCRLLEKSRGLGGRCATRRFHNASFDHGAQFFTVRNPPLKALAESWLEQDSIREWCRGFPCAATGAGAGVDGYPRYCSSPGMNRLPKVLGSGLTIEKQVLVTSIERAADGWHVASSDERHWHSHALIVTAPLPQTLALLEPDVSRQVLTCFPALQEVDYDPCFTVMLALSGESGVPPPGAIREPNSAIDWIADNSMKHETGGPAALTVHTSAAFTRRHFDAPQEDVAAAVIEEVQPYLMADVAAWQVHRWRYAKPREPLSVGALALPGTHPLVLSGDYLNTPARLEGAFDSGISAATYILAQS